MRFSVYKEETGGSSVWSEIHSAVEVNQGNYSVILGENVPFSPSTFSNDYSLWLELEVDVDNDGFDPSDVYSPRQRITSAAWAIDADRLAGRTASDFQRRVTGTASEGRYIIGVEADGSVVTAPLPSGSGGTLDNAYDFGGTGAGRAITADSGPVLIEGTDGLESIGNVGTAGNFEVHDGLGGAVRAELSSFGTGGRLLLWDEGGTRTVFLGASTDGGFMQLYNSSQRFTVTLNGDASGDGRLTMRSDDGGPFSYESTVHLWASNGSGGSLKLDDLDGVELVDLWAGSAGGRLELLDDSSNKTIDIRALNQPSNGPMIRLADTANHSAVLLTTDNGAGGAGNVQVFDADGDATIELQGAEGAAQGGQLVMRDESGNNKIVLDSDFNDYGNIRVYDPAGQQTVEIVGSEGSDGGQITLRKADGSLGVTIDGEFGASGDGRVTTEELEITGGSDLAEQFDIQPAGGKVEPGMVVSIDPARPGQLRVSNMAYDRTVAGIVSGAGGVKPGMLMGQAGTTANGDHPVALTGRVYCWCETSNGAIEPGDLLTTSEVPGHAMKVADSGNAHGAILGKAMTGLAEERGLVLVLVALH